MGSCIICGTSVDGHICQSHEEDVVFEFRGDRPDQLTPGRFYRGTVDGYADFGVFVNIGDSVTGLLHRSKLDRRLESLGWEVGDTVFVQVTNVRDNGDVDLGWSIRQSEREFRGMLIDKPSGEELPEEPAAEPEPEDSRREAAAETAEPEVEPEPVEPETAAEPESETTESESESESAAESGSAAEPEAAAEPAESAELERVPIAELESLVGDDVRIEGEVVGVRQTSGPTVFEVRDESAAVDCAAFEEAGVRAYPNVENGDIVRLDGEVRVRRDELQLETEALVVLDGEEREAVRQRMEDALTARALPETLEPLVDADVVAADTDVLREAAGVVRRAVLESRPVVVRHDASADGYVAGAALERAVLPLIEEEHAKSDATYHFFDRRPLEEGVYGMSDATKDVTSMLDNRERHDEKLPLVVFASAASTRDSANGLDLLAVYDVETLVVDGTQVDPEVADAAETVVAPQEDETTASALAANVAVGVNETVRDDLRHLPAVSFWDETPQAYVDLAAEAGYDEETTRRLRESMALEAYYQSYEDKRELVEDLLFEDGESEGLAEQVSDQFREKLEAEIDTAEANLDERTADGATFSVLDTDAYTHRFDFPPASLLLDELHRRHKKNGAPFVTIGIGLDELRVRSTEPLDLRAVADRASEVEPDAGIAARGTHAGRIEFLAGERDDVLDAVVDAVAENL
ncbi:MAG: DHH family phosphoesterase [Haloarculaceae archaeon]